MEKDIWDQLSETDGNETVYRCAIDALLKGEQLETVREYPFPLKLPTDELVQLSTLMKYYLANMPFSLEEAKIVLHASIHEQETFSSVTHEINRWVIKTIQQPFFPPAHNYHFSPPLLKEGVNISGVNPDHLIFICFTGTYLVRYGENHEYITANMYYEYARALGSSEPEKLANTGYLPSEQAKYEDEEISLTANDSFSYFRINMKSNSETAYRKALEFINQWLTIGFPRSYAIEFNSTAPPLLPIDGLPKADVHRFFAGAVRYPSLHELIAQYAQLSMRQYELYLSPDLQSESSCIPSTFAVFALGLQDEKYFPLVSQFMQLVDGDHSQLHGHFLQAFMEKFGVKETTIDIVIQGLSTMSNNPGSFLHDKERYRFFSDKNSLKILLSRKNKLAEIVSEEERNSFVEEDYQLMWHYLCSTIWSEGIMDVPIDTIREKALARSPEKLKHYYEMIFAQ